jgi:hypothetical protein
MIAKLTSASSTGRWTRQRWTVTWMNDGWKRIFGFE